MPDTDLRPRLTGVPVEFLGAEQAAAFGRFDGPPTQAELERFFFLDDADHELVAPELLTWWVRS